jgi:hypothetical protein
MTCERTGEPMSELGQSRHLGRRQTISGLSLEADIVTAGRHVSKVPKGDFTKSAAYGAKPTLWLDDEIG